jgi:hypothetical protein
MISNGTVEKTGERNEAMSDLWFVLAHGLVTDTARPAARRRRPGGRQKAKSHEPCDLVANSWPGDLLQVVRRLTLRAPPGQRKASKINTNVDNFDSLIHVACLLSSSESG